MLLVTAAVVIILLTTLARCQDDPNDQASKQVYIPAVNPYSLNRITFYTVNSQFLVQDPYRNPKHKATINSFSDFVNFPNIHPDSHFIPIGNTGFGMTLYGETAIQINQEIEKIVEQLPKKARRVTYYQRKDEKRFPYHNVYTGPFARTHQPPHQHYYRRY